MGSFAKSLFSVLFGWLEGVVSDIWKALSAPDGTGDVSWFVKNWVWIVVILCIAGVVIDLTIYLLRWRPNRVWAAFFRRMFGKQKEEEIVESGMNGQDDAEERSVTEETGREEEWERIPDREPERILTTQETRPITPAVRQELSESVGLEKWERPEEKKEEPVRPVDPYAAYRKPEEAKPKEEPRENAPVVKRTRRSDKYAASETKDTWKKTPATEGSGSQRERFTRAIRAKSGRGVRFSGYMTGHDENRVPAYQRPEPVIDRREAYRDPVYPPQWQRNEHKTGEQETNE